MTDTPSTPDEPPITTISVTGKVRFRYDVEIPEDTAAEGWEAACDYAEQIVLGAPLDVLMENSAEDDLDIEDFTDA